MESLFPGSPAMMTLIQQMNSRWWDKCSGVLYVASHDQMLQYAPEYAPPDSDIRSLPCSADELVALQCGASLESGKILKEEWRDRVLAATLDAFEKFPEIDKFAIETVEQFQDTRLNSIVRQLEIRMVELLRGVVTSSVDHWLMEVEKATTPLIYTSMGIPSHHEVVERMQVAEQEATERAEEEDGEEDGEGEGEKVTISLEITPTFHPSLESLSGSLCSVLDNVATTALGMDSLICPDLLAMLSIDVAEPMIHESVRREAVEMVVEEGRRKLREVMEEHLEGPKRMVESFQKFSGEKNFFFFFFFFFGPNFFFDTNF